MANFTDRLRIILDVDGRNADSSFKKFTTSVREAEGASGKLKAGWQNATQAISANAGALAVGAGAALVTFGIKAVNAFSKVAKAATDLSKATGLTVEEASRWIEIGDLYGVTAEQIAGALGRINKDLDATKWEKYGIATRDAAGRARSSNDIFMDVLEVLNNTSNGAERGRIAAELLGRGWQGIAPILGKSRKEYERMLAAVDDGQVITEEEARKAEAWREAQDNLGDALHNVTLQIGEQVAALSPYIERVAWLISNIPKVDVEHPDLGPVPGGNVLQQALKVSYDTSLGPFDKAREIVTGLWGAISGGSKEANENVKQLGANMFTTVDRTRALENAMAGVGDEAEGVLDWTHEIARLLGELDENDAARDLAAAFDDVASSAEEAWTATAEGADNASAAQRGAAQSVDDLKRKVAEYATQVLNLPEQQVVHFLAQIDQGQFAAVQAALNALAKKRYAPIIPSVALLGVGTGPKHAGGTPSAASGLALVGEQGPELVQFAGGERVFAAGRTRSMLSGGSGGGVYIENLYARDFDDLLRQLQQHVRRNGGVL